MRGNRSPPKARHPFWPHDLRSRGPASVIPVVYPCWSVLLHLSEKYSASFSSLVQLYGIWRGTACRRKVLAILFRCIQYVTSTVWCFSLFAKIFQMFNSEYTSGNGLKTSISTLRFTKVLPSYSKHIFLLNMKNIMKVCLTTYLDTDWYYGYMDCSCM